MLPSINYNRFGQNQKRAGFNSIKRVKSKCYMTVLDSLEHNDESNLMNQIEFLTDNDQTLEQIYETKNDVFESVNINEQKPNNIEHKDHEILKLKTMTKFLEISKSSKSTKKYAKQI